MSEIHALATKNSEGKLQPFSYDPGPLPPDQVEIDVLYCGICHSDLSMLHNDWQFTQYPFVPGHEAVGKISAVGERAQNVHVGQTVGLGWNSGSCLHCKFCLAGDQNMCASLEQTIVARHGAFATKVRCHWLWATPIPEGLDISKTGPMLCGGITVFNPLVQFGVSPLSKVAVIGIGGLGHMALQFMNRWGCDVTAFSSTAAKAEEAKKLGAHNVLDSRSAGQLKQAAGSFDFILSTVNADLDWNSYLQTLAPKGRLHFVGVTPAPVAVSSFLMIAAQRSVSGSPSGAPVTVNRMLDFAARHAIAPVTEEFPMSRANEAMDHLAAGKARYRIVLKNDLA